LETRNSPKKRFAEALGALDVLVMGPIELP